MWQVVELKPRLEPIVQLKKLPKGVITSIKLGDARFLLLKSLKRGAKCCEFLLKKFGHLKCRGKNFGDRFFDVFWRAESESEVNLSQKNPDHEISKLSCLVVCNCSRQLYMYICAAGPIHIQRRPFPSPDRTYDSSKTAGPLSCNHSLGGLQWQFVTYGKERF